MPRLLFLSAGILLGGMLILGGISCLKDDRDPSSNSDKVTGTDTVITPEAKIRDIDDGLSSVLFEGDDGMDAFITQGGASSDRAVLSFLTKNLLSQARGLTFNGAAFGCSTISVKRTGGGRLFGRNFDWKTCDAMVVKTIPTKGYRSISTVNMDFIRKAGSLLVALMPDGVLARAALYAPLDGMNEKGLCVAVNMIEDSETVEQDTGKPDLTTTTAIRLLLDRAASVEEAVRILKSHDFHASFGFMVHFALADAAGKSCVVEYAHNQMRVVNTPVVTNFYLAEGDKKGIGSAQSHTRYNILKEILSNTDRMDKDEVAQALSRVSKRHFTEFLSTEWSIVFDQKDLVARYYHRENYTLSFSFKLRQ